MTLDAACAEARRRSLVQGVVPITVQVWEASFYDAHGVEQHEYFAGWADLRNFLGNRPGDGFAFGPLMSFRGGKEVK